MTSNERTIALSGLARQIAYHLHSYHGQAWEFVEPTEDHYSVYLRNGTNARIYFDFDGYNEPKRLTVSGHLHIGKNGQFVEVYERSAQGTWNKAFAPSITVAIARGCQAIAKDIAKRFLPEYLRVFSLAQDKVRADAEYDAQITANLQRLAEVAHEHLSPGECYSRGVRTSFTWKHGSHYDTVIASAKDCSLKLDSLTIQQAEQIIRYLNGEAVI